MGATAESDKAAHGWLESLAAGFLAGGFGGLLFLGVGLARALPDFLSYWPEPAIAVALIVRSLGLYPLLFGAAGGALGGLIHPLLAGRDRSVFAAVLGAMTAVTVLAYLTAWWQLEVLAGLPLADSARLRGGLTHAAVALASGAAVTAGWLRLGRARVTRPRVRTTGAVLAVAVVLLASGEAGMAISTRGTAPGSAAERPRQVVVVGLDGMTLRVLSPLLRAGELPSFRRLMEEGAWGSLLTYGAASSPRLWTSMATGKRVRDHGIDDFVKVRSASYRALAARSSDRKARALWNILSDFGRRVGVVNWLITYPPEEVNGYMVSRLTLKAKDRTYPRELDAELAGLWGKAPRGYRQRLLWNADRVFDAAGYLLRKERLDFLALLDSAVDNAEHRTWKYYESASFDPELWDLDPAEAAELATLIPDVYRHLDRRLGELLEQVGDDALVIVLSDHGQLAAATPRVHLLLDRVLAALGYTRLEPGKGGGDRVDYAASRAYTLVETPWTPVLRVNVNLEGRNRHGIVPREEAGAVADRLVADLGGVRFVDGTPLFGRVTRAPETAGGQGADIHVPLSRHARSRDRASRLLEIGGERRPLAEFQRVHSRVSGDHDHQGVIFVRGPGVEPGMIGQRAVPTAINDLVWHLTDKLDTVDALLPILRRLGLIERATTLDLTPTVLYALGLPVGRDMAGRPLEELFSRPRAVEWVASYETLADPRLADEEAPSDEEYLERLRALGYVN